MGGAREINKLQAPAWIGCADNYQPLYLHFLRLAHVEKAADALAVDTLLISDKLFRYIVSRTDFNSLASLLQHKERLFFIDRFTGCQSFYCCNMSIKPRDETQMQHKQIHVLLLSLISILESYLKKSYIFNRCVSHMSPSVLPDIRTSQQEVDMYDWWTT